MPDAAEIGRRLLPARRGRLLMLCIGLLWVSFQPCPVWPEDRAADIARKIDTLYRSNTSYAEVEMEIVTPHWSRTMEMKVWSEGTDKTFLRILSPKKDQGVGTLRIGNEMWNYFPRINKVIKIPPSMMMGSWMGSDFTNDDLVREFTFLEDFAFRMAQPADAVEGMLYLEARPKEGVPVVWDRILTAVRESDLMPVWEKFYDQKGELIREMTFSNVTRFGRREAPSIVELVPAKKQGHKTILRYKVIQFDIRLDEDIMTLRRLRSGN